MRVTSDEIRSFRRIPEMQDRIMAARTASAICAVAALWFFVSPWAYFGVSEQGSGWNAWLIGAVMFLLCCQRLFHTVQSTTASWINAGLGVWVFLSPWVFGYTGYLGHWINSMCVGAIIIGFSIFSATFTRPVQAVRIDERLT